MARERGQEGGFTERDRYLVGGFLALFAVASLGAGNLVVAGLFALGTYATWPRSPKPA